MQSGEEASRQIPVASNARDWNLESGGLALEANIFYKEALCQKQSYPFTTKPA
jgi:hypothetical protein